MTGFWFLLYRSGRETHTKPRVWLLLRGQQDPQPFLDQSQKEQQAEAMSLQFPDPWKGQATHGLRKGRVLRTPLTACL